MGPFASLNRYLSRSLTPAAKTIFLINVGVFLAAILASEFFPTRRVAASNDPSDPRFALTIRESPVEMFVVRWLAENPDGSRLRVWQYVTYMFVHLQGLHLLFNLAVLWFFAPELEVRWGTSRFWRFYLFTGIGAGILHTLYASLPGAREHGPVIGASGALYGVLLAYGAYYPNRAVFIYGVLPMPMKFCIPLLILLDAVFLSRGADNVSHVTHLAGLAVAFFYLAKYHRTSDIRRWRFLR